METGCFRLSSAQRVIQLNPSSSSVKLRRFDALSSCRQQTTARTSSLIRCSRGSANEDELGESPQLHRVQVKPPAWVDVAIDRRSNAVGLPLSLQMIKREIQWAEGIRGASESAYSSVKKAFSSLVLIIRELHSYTLYMREALSGTGDMRTILDRVQTEIHISFVWLFQRIFSHTPTLMVSVMILLANFSVHSVASTVAISSVEVAAASVIEADVYLLKPTLSLPEELLGSGGSGGKMKPGSSSGEGEGGRLGLHAYKAMVSESLSDEKELSVWESLVTISREENGAFEGSTGRGLVAPVSVGIEPDDDILDYHDTASAYQVELQKDPCNPLLLANYAQFLYLVAKDYHRAEEFFKKAMVAEPKDPETYSKYGSFMWKVRKNICAAEESLLEAIAVEPSNSFYAANYANFLWKTGGDDTCYFPFNVS